MFTSIVIKTNFRNIIILSLFYCIIVLYNIIIGKCKRRHFLPEFHLDKEVYIFSSNMYVELKYITKHISHLRSING